MTHACSHARCTAAAAKALRSAGVGGGSRKATSAAAASEYRGEGATSPYAALSRLPSKSEEAETDGKATFKTKLIVHE